jgi:hypothetical protein
MLMVFDVDEFGCMCVILYMALLRTVTSGGADVTKNCMVFLKSPDSQ